MPWDGVFQANYAYTSAVNYALTLDPYTVQKGYGILNLSAGIRDPGEKYQITLFVDNALNTHYHSDLQDLNGTFGAQEAIVGSRRSRASIGALPRRLRLGQPGM